MKKVQKKKKPVKLNLGSGSLKIDGYKNIDIKNGVLAYPLKVKDGSCDEIRASHLLEHFGNQDVFAVVKHWAEKLKDGGVLKIAVPDFSKIANAYVNKKKEMNVSGYLMGGQSDQDDYHKSIFDREALTMLLESAGLTDITDWTSEIQDCASLPISLNLKGVKAPKKEPVMRKISAVMSMPRITFTDTFTCVMRAIVARGIPFMRSSGVFWGQCLTRMLETVSKKEDLDYILTVDYDSWFEYDDILALVALLEKHPEYDAVMPIQIKRESDNPLATIKSPNGGANGNIPVTYLEDNEIVEAHSGHFGLTVFRKSCFEKIKKPWFMPKPDPQGGWNDGRTDEDITFWKNFAAAGCKLGLATRVGIGHLQLMVTFPGTPESAFKPVNVRVSELEK